jgi:hypothetical protein
MYKKCKNCECNYSSEYDLCPGCLAKSLGIFWVAPDNHRVFMHSDGDQFIATINAGIEGETFLSVGYSCPNYAWIEPKMIDKIKIALDEAWLNIEQKDLKEMIPALYSLCEVANKEYNRMA